MSFRPEPNKAVERDRELKAYEAHRRRVENAQPTVDTRPPRTYMHQHLNMKRLQKEEERLAQIERDNRKLLQRMSDIMRSGGRIDNKNDYEHRSNAGRDKRRNDTLHITKENQYIHDRIVSRRPEYDHKQWEKDWKVTQKRLEQLSSYNSDGTEKYPRRPGRTDKKPVSAQSSARSVADSREGSRRSARDSPEGNRKRESRGGSSADRSENERSRESSVERDDAPGGEKRRERHGDVVSDAESERSNSPHN